MKGAYKLGLSCYRIVYHGLASPVEFAVVDVAAAVEQISEHPPQLVVVGRLEEVEPAYVA